MVSPRRATLVTAFLLIVLASLYLPYGGSPAPQSATGLKFPDTPSASPTPADSKTAAALAMLAAHPLPCSSGAVAATMWATLPPWVCEDAATQEAFRQAGVSAAPPPASASFPNSIVLAQDKEDLFAYRTFFFGRRNGLILVSLGGTGLVCLLVKLFMVTI